MTLPASQYSVLDAKQIERIDDSTFRCYVGGLRFLGFTIEPVLTVSVNVTEKGPTVRLLSTKVRRLCCNNLPLPLTAFMTDWSCPRLNCLILISADACAWCSSRAHLQWRLPMTDFQQ